MKSVLYPGSFDPFTTGHLDLVIRARQLFDRVVVAVAVNSGKHPLFTLEERKQLIEKSCALLSNVEVVTFTGLLVDAIDDFHAQAVLRGLRAFSDFEYELQMALMSADTLMAGSKRPSKKDGPMGRISSLKIVPDNFLSKISVAFLYSSSVI